MPHTHQNSHEISIYKGELDTRSILTNVAKIKQAFPSLPLTFFEVFDERIHANGFSSQRLNDAVSHVIDTCVYPVPTIANFISFDKKVKILSHAHVCDIVSKGEDSMDSFKPIKIKGRNKPVWIHINDIRQYNIKDNVY